MKTTQTALAVGLAIIVVAVFFVFPGLNPFGTGIKTTRAQQPNATPTNPSNNVTATSTTATTMTTPDGLQITDQVTGSGAVAEPGDTVTVNYVGSLTNGTIFDASANHPQTKNGFSFVLGQGHVIKGWDEGLVGMKVGGKRKLVIPPGLAYGDRAMGSLIPANSTLVFEVELLNVQQPGQ